MYVISTIDYDRFCFRSVNDTGRGTVFTRLLYFRQNRPSINPPCAHHSLTSGIRRKTYRARYQIVGMRDGGRLSQVRSLSPFVRVSPC